MQFPEYNINNHACFAALPPIYERNLPDQDMIDKVLETEHKVDLYEKYLTEYLIKVNNLSITEEQHLMVNNLFHAIIDIERVSDHAENMAEAIWRSIASAGILIPISTIVLNLTNISLGLFA